MSREVAGVTVEDLAAAAAEAELNRFGHDPVLGVRRGACSGGVPMSSGDARRGLMPAAVGSLPGCGAWLATAETAAGRLALSSCGSIAGRRECPLEERVGGYIPLPGDYVRFVPGGRIAAWGDIRVIEEFAVASLLAQAPGSGSGWVTSPAGAG